MNTESQIWQKFHKDRQREQQSNEFFNKQKQQNPMSGFQNSNFIDNNNPDFNKNNFKNNSGDFGLLAYSDPLQKKNLFEKNLENFQQALSNQMAQKPSPQQLLHDISQQYKGGLPKKQQYQQPKKCVEAQKSKLALKIIKNREIKQKEILEQDFIQAVQKSDSKASNQPQDFENMNILQKKGQYNTPNISNQSQQEISKNQKDKLNPIFNNTHILQLCGNNSQIQKFLGSAGKLDSYCKSTKEQLKKIYEKISKEIDNIDDCQQKLVSVFQQKLLHFAKNSETNSVMQNNLAKTELIEFALEKQSIVDQCDEKLTYYKNYLDSFLQQESINNRFTINQNLEIELEQISLLKMHEKYDNQLKDLGNEFIGIKLLNSEETDIFKIQYENGQIIPEFLIRLQLMPKIFIEDEDRLIVNQFVISKQTKQIIQVFEKQPSASCLIRPNHIIFGYGQRSQLSYYLYDGEKYNKEWNFAVIGDIKLYNILKVCKNPFMDYSDLRKTTIFTISIRSIKPSLFRFQIDLIDHKINFKKKLCVKTEDIKFLDDTYLVSIERFEFRLLNYHTREELSTVEISSYQHIIIPTNFNLRLCPYLLNFDNKTQFINIIDIMNSGYQGKYNISNERIKQIKLLQNYEGLQQNSTTNEEDDSIILLGIDEEGLLKTYRLTIKF